VAVEVAAGLDVAFGFEFALGLAASVLESIDSCRSFSELPLGLLARLRRLTMSPILHSMSRSG
jgi:hypothetical protein